MVYELFPGLHRIRDMLKEQSPNYPRECCSFTSEVLEEGVGFPRVGGYFRNDSPRKHDWSYDPESDAYIDFTACQFDEGLPDILVVPRRSPEAVLLYVETGCTRDNADLARRRAEFRAALSRNGH